MFSSSADDMQLSREKAEKSFHSVLARFCQTTFDSVHQTIFASSEIQTED